MALLTFFQVVGAMVMGLTAKEVSENEDYGAAVFCMTAGLSCKEMNQSFQVFLLFWGVDMNKLRHKQLTGQKKGVEKGIPNTLPLCCSCKPLLLPLHNVHVDMSQRASLWAPSPMHDLVLITLIQCLDQIGIFSSTILPMKLTNLIIIVKKVQAALTSTTALGANLTNTALGDLNLVDLFFSQGLTAVFGVVELAAAGC